jgi:hypothetical protein
MMEFIRNSFSVFFGFILLEVFISILVFPGSLILALSRLNPYLRNELDSAGGYKRFWIEGLIVKSVLVLGFLTYLFNAKAWFGQTFLWMAMRREFIFAFPFVYVLELMFFAFRRYYWAKAANYACHLYFSIIVSSFFHFASQQ